MVSALLACIEAELEGNPLRQHLLTYAGNLLHFYEEQRADSTERFQKALTKYRDLDKSSEYPHLTLFTGSGIHEYRVCLDYDGDITDDDEEIGVLVPHPEIGGDYEPATEEEEYTWVDESFALHRRIVLTWLADIWQKLKGYDYGLVVKTLENSSVREFYFNDLASDDASEYFMFNDASTPVERHFPEDLSVEALFERTK
jgi:hypothetical protein